MSEKAAIYSIAAGLVAAALIVAGCATTTGDSARQKASINSTLVGMNLTYYSIAGVPMSYTIVAEDITSIEPTTYNKTAGPGRPRSAAA